MKSKMGFKYDVLIDEKDMCNRKKEIDLLLKKAKERKKTVLFAPRRYGKTSLVKNIIGKKFCDLQSKNILIYVDLMDVRSFQSIAERLQYSISIALAKHFPIKTLLNQIAVFFKGISMNVEVDQQTGQPSINFSVKENINIKGCRDLLDVIKTISQKYHLMLVLDEFHDITFVDESQALFRSFLQELSDTSIFILGSKRHLLQLLFSDVNAPLFNFGDEMHLGPISVDDWLHYFNERLSQVDVKIGMGEMIWIADEMYNVPNSICELGAWLLDHAQKAKLTIKSIKMHLDELVNTKQSYHYLLQGYTENEKNVLKKIAVTKYVNEPSSISFLDSLNISKSSVGKVFSKLMDLGTIEYEIDKGYRISDPILGHFMATR